MTLYNGLIGLRPKAEIMPSPCVNKVTRTSSKRLCFGRAFLSPLLIVVMRV